MTLIPTGTHQKGPQRQPLIFRQLSPSQEPRLFLRCEQPNVAAFMHGPSVFVRFALLKLHGLFTDNAAWKPTFVGHDCLLGERDSSTLPFAYIQVCAVL